MDKIWYRNPSKPEVTVRCGGDEKKTNDHAEPTKDAKKSKTKKQCVSYILDRGVYRYNPDAHIVCM